jgi:PAS domain S-box-containing protein
MHDAAQSSLRRKTRQQPVWLRAAADGGKTMDAMTARMPMADRLHSSVARFGAAIAIALAVVAIRWILAPLLGDRHPYMTVLISVVLSVWYCGPGPAAVACMLSFAASHALFGLPTSRYEAGVYGQAMHVALVAAETFGIAWLVWSQQQAKRALSAQVQAALLAKERLAAEIAERRPVEDSLRTSREEFEVLATKAPVGILRADATGQCTFANEQWCQMTGYAADEMLGYAWSRTVHPDDLAATMSRWEASVQEQRPYTNDLRLVRKDGGIRFVTASALPIHAADGAVTGFIGTVIDTTEQRQAEEHIRRKDAQLRSIVDNASAVIFLKDSAGRYLLANRRFYESFRQYGDDVVGKTDAEWFPEDVARRLVEADAQVWDSAAPIAVEESTPLADGLHTYLTVKFPVTDHTGRMTALGGISTDITELKRVRDSLEHKQKLLRNLIDIQEREKQLLCNEFHDGLIQYAVGSKMMLESCRDDHSHQLPATVAKTLDHVVDYLAKGIEDGRRVILGIRPAVLDDLGLAAAIGDLADQFPGSELKITTAIDPDIGSLPKPLQTSVYRIVQESLSNAHKHSGARHVHIELHRSAGSLHVTVRDDGCGFDVAAARGQGFGLLGMSERVQLAGGELSVESMTGTGTQVAVRLPILQPE